MDSDSSSDEHEQFDKLAESNGSVQESGEESDSDVSVKSPTREENEQSLEEIESRSPSRSASPSDHESLSRSQSPIPPPQSRSLSPNPTPRSPSPNQHSHSCSPSPNPHSRSPSPEPPESPDSENIPNIQGPDTPATPSDSELNSLHDEDDAISDTKEKHGPSDGPASPEPDGEISDSDDSSGSITSYASSTKGIENPPSNKSQIEKNDRTEKPDVGGHGEDLSDVSDLESLDEMSDGEEKFKKEDSEENDAKSDPPSQINESIKSDNCVGVPGEETEQLDFEAEEKEEGECEEKEKLAGPAQTSTNSAASAELGQKDQKSDDEGELKGEELEEGELTEDDENRPEETEPRPVCRFYNRGQCTWGASCRFLHPGVTDKGNYTMFDMVRPMPVPPLPYPPSLEYRVPYGKPVTEVYGLRKEDVPVIESAWERGLRQAKEMMRKSTKRKETDMDFEEKKMNLSIGQEELDKENDYYTHPASPVLNEEDRWGLKHIDGIEGREDIMVDRYEEYADYYARGAERGGIITDCWGRRIRYDPSETRPLHRSASGSERPAAERSSKYHHSSSGHHHHHSGSDHHHHRESSTAHRSSSSAHVVATAAVSSSHHSSTEYYDKHEKKRREKPPAREVIVQRVDKPWRDERYNESSTTHRTRGDEWADPWMRSKSPSTKKQTSSRRRQSYSSGSSYSSSSSRSSSSQSSYSYSGGSRSRSPRSKSPKSRSRSPSSKRKSRPIVPTSRTQDKTVDKSKTIANSEKRPERQLLMNPPAPSPRPKQRDSSSASGASGAPALNRTLSPGMMRKSAQNPPAPGLKTLSSSRAALVAKAASKVAQATEMATKSSKHKMRSHSKSSRSSSGSDSSGSSSDSSESSYSSSSSSREPSPRAIRPPKRIVIDEHERLAMAQSMKVKALDALKLSGQKQQIKLTLKTPGANPAAPAKRSVTGLPELPELNLVRKDRGASLTIVGKKRPAESLIDEDSPIAAKMAALAKPPTKKAASRREELLKQLKAVEDAIARKRSKI